MYPPVKIGARLFLSGALLFSSMLPSTLGQTGGQQNPPATQQDEVLRISTDFFRVTVSAESVIGAT